MSLSLSRPSHRLVLPYGFAVLAVSAALALVAQLHPVLDAGSYMVFFAAVVVVSGIAGLGPGLVASVLAIMAVDFFFLLPVKTLRVVAQTDLLLLIVFGVVAIATAWTAGALHRRLGRASREAERAAGLARFLERHARELEHDLDAIHALRSAPRQQPRGRQGPAPR